MRTRFFRRLGGFLSALLLLISPVPAGAADDPALAMREGILRYHGVTDVQSFLDGALPDGTAEWYVFALRLSGEWDFSAYRAALTGYLDGKGVAAATTRQKYALALLASGGGHPYVTAVLSDSIGEMGLLSYVFGLHLLENGCMSPGHTVESVTAEILARQCADGGWAVTGTAGDPDVTAMVVQALAPGYSRTPAVATAVERALAFLSGAQTTAGGFVSYGEENAESTAQVMLALAALGIDGETDARFIKEGTMLSFLQSLQMSSGGFAHAAGGTESSAATAQVMLALSAYLRFTEMGAAVRPYLFGLSAEDLPAGDVPAEQTPGGYKPWAVLATVVAGTAVCAVIFLQKRRWQVLAAPLLITVLAVAVILATDIRLPEDYYTAAGSPGATDTGEAIGTVTVSIRCDAVAGEAAHIPADGVILGEVEIPLHAGDTVYDVTMAAARAHRIIIENDGTPEMAYIVGIANVYALAFGDMSGWVYTVNGETPDVGCEGYRPGVGDVVRWEYVRGDGA